MGKNSYTTTLPVLISLFPLSAVFIALLFQSSLSLPPQQVVDVVKALSAATQLIVCNKTRNLHLSQ